MNRSAVCTCPICKGNDVILMGKPQISPQGVDIINKEYQVVKCKTCNFYYVYPQISLSAEVWEKLYAVEYFSNKTSWWIRKRDKDLKQRFDWLQKYCRHNIQNFLDVGCGEGYTLLEALKRGWKTYGIDISDNRVAEANNEHVIFHKSDISQTNFPTDFFDCIYMDSVLEHLTDPCRHLLEIKRILRKGGVLYIGVPNEDCLFNEVKRLLFILMGKHNFSAYLYPFKRPYHIIGFTKDSLLKILQKSGFDILRFRNFSGEYEYRKFKFFTKPFLVNFFLLPVHLVAIPLKKRIYLDTIVTKSHSSRQ